jgi:small subunit ribosomal protein S16
MSVKIRLQRGGRKALPVYSIVVADSREARDSKFIARLGFYAPKARGQEVPFSINEEQLNGWVAKGALVTDVVARLLVKYNVGPEKVRAAFTAEKARRMKVAELKAAKVAKGEELKAAAAAKAEAEAAAKAQAEAAAKAQAEAKAAEAEAAKAAAAAAAEAPAETPAA